MHDRGLDSQMSLLTGQQQQNIAQVCDTYLYSLQLGGGNLYCRYDVIIIMVVVSWYSELINFAKSCSIILLQVAEKRAKIEELEFKLEKLTLVKDDKHVLSMFKVKKRLHKNNTAHTATLIATHAQACIHLRTA